LRKIIDRAGVDSTPELEIEFFNNVLCDAREAGVVQ
jgi:hypothetical protein